MGQEEEYAIPKPSRIKLKETPEEQARKLYRAEQLRQSRLAERVSRANDEPGPSYHLHRSYSSHHSSRPQHYRWADDDEEGPYYPGHGAGQHHHDQWDGPWRPHRPAFGDVEEAIRIPSRFAGRSAAGFGSYVAADPIHNVFSADPPRRSRRAEDEVQLEGGPIPSMGSMSSTQYQAWIREGMDKMRRKQDVWVREQEARERDRARAERDAAIEQERADRDRRARRERRRYEQAEADRRAGQAEADAQAAERAAKKRRTEARDGDVEAGERKTYLARWKALGGSGDADVMEVEIAFGDIPWPVYRLKGEFGGIDVGMLSGERVGLFLRDLARDSGGSLRKVQMEAIRQFHPDRFFGRILPRVRVKDEAAIREGVERCSRVINALMADRNA